MNLTGLIMNIQLLRSAQLQEQLTLKLIESAVDDVVVVETPAVDSVEEVEVSLEEGQTIDIRV